MGIGETGVGKMGVGETGTACIFILCMFPGCLIKFVTLCTGSTDSSVERVSDLIARLRI